MTNSSVPAQRVQAERKVYISPAVWAILLFLLALTPRLPGLRAFLTSDERTNLYWAGSQFVEGLLSGDLSLTYWHFYPGVSMSWLEALGLAGSWALAHLSGEPTETLAQFVHRPILDLILAARLPYALLTAAGVAAFYLMARRLLRHRMALLGALFIAFDPFFLAHSRVAHGDAPVTVFMVLSTLAFLVYLQDVSSRSSREVSGAEAIHANMGRWWLVISAVMGSLAALTKAPGQFMALFVVVVAAGDWLLKSWQAGRLDWRLARRWLLDLVLWGGLAALLFVALWPVMWVNPVGTLVRMLDETFGKVGEGHLVFFMGQPTLNPGPWFYPYVIAFRLTPITLIGTILSVALLAVRAVALARRGAKESWLPHRYLVVALLWFYVVSLLLFGNLSPKKQDRYLLPLLPILDLLAAFAYMEIIHLANQRAGKWANARYAMRIAYALRITLPVFILIIHAFPIVTTYPYYLAYFNPLMGGLPRAVETTLVGWGEGMEQAAAYLNQRSDADQLYVASVPAQTFLPYFKGTGENFYTNDVALRADYVVLYVSQAQRLAPSARVVRYFLAMDPEYTVHVLGEPYVWIYPGSKLITEDVPSDAKLTNVGISDQLRLAGYQIADQQASNIQPGHTLELVLYWHALAPMTVDYTVSVRVVSPDGTWLAQQDSWPADGLMPTSQWRQGDYVRDEHALVMSSEVVPGEYALQVVVYEAASGAALNEALTVATLSVEEISP